MERFLHFKHWQLFIGIVGVPIIFNIIFMVIGASNAIQDQDPAAIFDIMRFLPLVILIPLFLTMGWYWAMGIGLHRKLPEGVNMNVKRFRVFLTIPAIYFVALMILIVTLFTGVSDSIRANEAPSLSSIANIAGWMVIILPLHFFSIFCIFYCMYFSAKTYRSVLLGREAEIGDYIGDFFLIWFGFIGLWIIQPKINRLAGGGNSEVFDQ